MSGGWSRLLAYHFCCGSWTSFASHRCAKRVWARIIVVHVPLLVPVMTSDFPRRFFYLLFAVLLAVVLLIVAYFHRIDPEMAMNMLHEDGVVEKLSALGYFACLLVMAFVGGMRYLHAHLPLAALVTLLGMRELDFDKRFTETGLLQSRIFTSADVALLERVIGIGLMLVLVVLAVVVIRRYSVVLLRRLMRFDPAAIGVGLALTLMVLSKTIDGLGRKLQPLGISLTENLAFSAAVFEEVLELGIPVALIIATLAYVKRPAATAQLHSAVPSGSVL
jgi:hypothetical protein